VKKKTLTKAIKLANILCPINRDNGLPTSHVAFLVKKNKIVKIGWNKNRTHPIIQDHPYHEGRVGIHAELDCILKYDKEDLSDHEMIVLRLDRKQKLNNSKPCSGCSSLLKQFNINKVYFSNSEGKIDNY